MSSIATHLSTRAIRIPIGGGVTLDADYTLPPGAKGVVLFAHGSGSSRLSPRNRYVASELNAASMATVLADLLTPMEEKIDDSSGRLRFDVALLSSRVIQLIDWVHSYNLIATLPAGLFGASTGAAAALDAAAARPAVVRAVVSRGGRADLATRLAEVKAPTLLIVGGNDTAVLRMNTEAFRQLACTKQLTVIPGASHLFEEPRTLETAAAASAAWFERHLSAGDGTRRNSE